MVAVLQDPGTPVQLELARGARTCNGLLTVEARVFLGALHVQFEARRQDLLAARVERQAAFDRGGLPDFRADTASLRAADWQVAPPPPALVNRRVEITGPTDPKTVINALNSGADCFMADFEDSTSPTWDNLLAGQQVLRDAVTGDLAFTSPAGKAYALVPAAERAVLIVRPRGWHLDEKHVEVEGARMAASLFDAGLFLFHTARALAARDRGPYLYLPKLESMEEAALWQDALAWMEGTLGLPPGQVKVTVLIETLPAAFEMDEILHALRDRAVGLNCGRWDYIFSYIKTLRAHRDRVLPERGQVGMDQPFLRAYAGQLIRTCHRRGAHAMGGMAAQIPIARDPEANAAAMARVRADKQREVDAGHDGTWVAHPGLIPIAREAFGDAQPARAGAGATSGATAATRDDLLRCPRGTISRAGFEGNVEVCVRYLAAWLAGNGCVPIRWLMEDAATAEIARAQLWQWLHHGDLHLDDDTPVDVALFECALLNLPSCLAGQALPGKERLPEAIALLEAMTHAAELPAFLTLAAYERLD